MNLRQLTEDEKQHERARADQVARTIQQLLGTIAGLYVTNTSAHNHAVGAMQHLRQAITDLDTYTRVL